MQDSLHILLKYNPYLPWFRGILGGIEAYAEAHGLWHFIYDELHPNSVFRGQKITGWVDGVITDRPDPWALEKSIPQVAISISQSHPECPSFTTDFVEVGRLAARHLIHAGYRELALLQLTNPNHEVDLSRDRGFREEAEKHGIPWHRLELP